MKSLTAGQIVVGIGILVAVVSFFVPEYPLLAIAVIIIGAGKFIP